ncbi:hypothetical protein [Salinicola halophyticus]|uniref:hypothetical protein n=1 Tax=Salinicola halophyticus TaxID=1808881 RepID=UPI000DA18D1D|nr:hypothetical protein [Salinicola halophyticus]
MLKIGVFASDGEGVFSLQIYVFAITAISRETASFEQQWVRPYANRRQVVLLLHKRVHVILGVDHH